METPVQTDGPTPWLTIEFYPSGEARVTRGPGEAPKDHDSIIRCNGAILSILWQVAKIGYDQLLANQQEEFNLQELLRRMPVSGEPS